MRNRVLKSKATLLFILLSITSIQVILAQKTLLNSDSLLARLRIELKLDHNEIKVNIDDFLPSCWIISNKTDLLVRKQQANGEKVTELLMAIISVKKGELYDKVKAIYDEFIVHYQRECLPLLKDDDNLQICRESDMYIDFIANQCQILGSFEFALTSLMFTKEFFTPEQIYSFEKKQFITWQNLIQSRQKRENINFVWDKWYFNSLVYHNSIKTGLTYNYIGKRVNHLAPFADEIEQTLLIAIDAFEFKEVVSTSKDQLYSNELLFLKRTIELLGLLSVKLSDKCEKTILDNYDKFAKSGRISWFYQSFDKTEMSPILTTFFLNNIFDNLIIQEASPYQRDFLFRSMWHESRRNLVKQVLLERLSDSNGEKRMLALYFLRIFPDKDVIEACLKIYQSKKKGIGERDRAKSNLTGFLQAPNLTEAQKSNIRRHLKN